MQRESIRREEYQLKEEGLINREKEVARKQDELETKEISLEQQKKFFEEDQKRNKQDRSNLMNILRKELREKEVDIAEKLKEISSLKAKLKTTEQDLRNVQREKDKKKDRYSNIVAENRRLQEECVKLQKTVEFGELSLGTRNEQIVKLQEENNTLKVEQSAQIRELTAQINKMALIIPSEKINPERDQEPDQSLSSRLFLYFSLSSKIILLA